MPTTPRLSRQERREQLLDAALSIVRAHGTDQLSLVTLAEAAGVSRPVVYDHFGTRPGLLLALYRRLADRLREMTSTALARANADPQELAQALSTAYFTCLTEVSEWTAVASALRGSPELEPVELELCDGFADMMSAAIAGHTRLSARTLRLRCFAVMGAAEILGAELIRGRATLTEATDALTGLILAGLDITATG
ncbi:TetR family transcriptional regulator [Nocardia tenerifensis]|uniref:TetR family transcriptional regulator n=1 Tax=Nocardia tenerifensis TaxID=228006 RepID=A0A318JP52_9NOCA|nr:TetR/AcrR family transcriptional regulator [Nocardia tenerifensis]PXX57387.1 TetR family transcriptional regulator [Nocardia tenerifensis]